MLRKITHGFSYLLVGAVLLSSQNVLAWGQNGHRIVGKIAENHITDATKAELKALLEGQSLAKIATWADEMRSDPSPFWQKNLLVGITLTRQATQLHLLTTTMKT